MLILTPEQKTLSIILQRTVSSGKNTAHSSHIGHVTQLLHSSAQSNKADHGLRETKHPYPEA